MKGNAGLNRRVSEARSAGWAGRQLSDFIRQLPALIMGALLAPAAGHCLAELGRKSPFSLARMMLQMPFWGVRKSTPSFLVANLNAVVAAHFLATDATI
jgi:hypothetical protein